MQQRLPLVLTTAMYVRIHYEVVRYLNGLAVIGWGEVLNQLFLVRVDATPERAEVFNGYDGSYHERVRNLRYLDIHFVPLN